MPEMIKLYVHVNVMSFAFVTCNSSEINDDDELHTQLYVVWRTWDHRYIKQSVM